MKMMKRVFRILAVLLLVAQSAVASLVAVLETESEGAYISTSEKKFLTDELRKQAVRVLPSENFIIMTRENVQMLLNDKKLEECIGSCAVETGRNLSAAYVVNSHVGHFEDRFSLTVELYSVKSKKLLGEFTAWEYEVAGLVDEIEKSAAEMFDKIMEDCGHKGKSALGISNVKMTNTRLTGLLKSRYLINFESEPAGANLKVDQNEYNCTTPCVVEVYEGRHQFSLEKHLYKSLDTSFMVKSKMFTTVSLLPNYGILTFDPQMGEYGSDDEISIKVDGRPVSSRRMKLSLGTHEVEFSHRCYETERVDVEVGLGEETVNLKLKPITGILNVETDEGWGAPLFVNGREIATLPYKGEVDVCAEISLGQRDNVLDVSIRKGKTTTYEYRTSFIDPGSGVKYEYVQIGSQKWINKDFSAGESCPAGWHMASSEEFMDLRLNVGLRSVDKLSKGINWDDPFDWLLFLTHSNIDSYGFGATSGFDYRTSDGGECGFSFDEIECSDKITGPLPRFYRCVKNESSNDNMVTTQKKLKQNATSIDFFGGFSGPEGGVTAGLLATTYFPYYFRTSLGTRYTLNAENPWTFVFKAGFQPLIFLPTSGPFFKIGVQVEKDIGGDFYYGVYANIIFFTLFGDLAVLTSGDQRRVEFTFPIDLFLFDW